MKPVLWHIEISHYSEKARWALDHKAVEYQRRAPTPGSHMPVALWLTRGRHKTFPILQLEGETIADSTAIIGALERRWPDAPLYPDDPDDRRRALDLEDFFDEELGPHSRLLVFHEAVRDPATIEKFTVQLLPAPVRDSAVARRVAGRFFSTFAGLRYGVKSDEAADLARAKVMAAFDRLESELDGRPYLVGDSFTVADLTAASLFYPIVRPAEGPPAPAPPDAIERFREPLKERPGYRWVEEIFRKHRRPVGPAANVPA
jgi:glutathione S-transferase